MGILLDMKAGFTTLAKLLAICVSLSLLGGYVWYRQDAAKKEQARLDALNEAREKAIAAKLAEMKGVDPLAIENVNLQGAGGEPFSMIGPDIMSSSKSGRVVMPSTKKAQVVMPSSKRAMVIPSTKSGIALSEEELKQLLQQAQEAEGQEPQKPRTVLPSSKSIDSILIPRDRSPRSRPSRQNLASEIACRR